MISLEKQIAL